MRRILILVPLLAGLAAAIVLTMPSVARAWDINALPIGYTIVGHIKNGTCTTYQIRGYGAALDLSDCRPDFQQALDAWVESTCPQAVCHPAPPATTAASSPPVTTSATTTTTVPPVTVTDTAPQPVTTVADTTPAPVDTTPAPPTITDTTAAVPAPAPPTVTQTVVVQTTLTDTTITQRLDLIDQRQATDEARLYALEHPTGQILGEPKNVAPFVVETSP